MTNQPHLNLNNGSRVAVIGGGPAGAFFSYFLLDFAERVGLTLHVDIYEPRNFYIPGPQGCNMCAGILHEQLVQTLAVDGINLSSIVVQRGMDSNILHMDIGSARIETPRHEKRIAATFRGIGPRTLREIKWNSLDGHLLGLAVKKGARQIENRVENVQWNDDAGQKRIAIDIHSGTWQIYDLIAVTAGVNTALLKQFQNLNFGYRAPQTTKCYVREYYLGEAAVEKYLGSSMHAFLLNIPRLEFGALIPKGDYVTVSLLGREIDDALLNAFVNDPTVKKCLPPNFPMDKFSCGCAPRINIGGSPQPFGDRIVFIGDCGVSRLYKDGNGAAYRAAKVAARAAIFDGISAEDFRKNYFPFCRTMEFDNRVGKLIFSIVHLFQRLGWTRRALLRMVQNEQEGKASAQSGMSMVLWDMFTGSAPYREIFWRTLQPVFWTRFLWALLLALLPTRAVVPESANAHLTVPAREEEEMWEAMNTEPGALGKLYADGEIIIRQGELGDAMYVIQEGRVQVVREQNSKEVVLGVMEEGHIFGETAIFENQPRSATARALGPARILTIDRQNFLRRIHEDPSLAYRMLQDMSRRVHELSAEIARLKTTPLDIP